MGPNMFRSQNRLSLTHITFCSHTTFSKKASCVLLTVGMRTDLSKYLFPRSQDVSGKIGRRDRLLRAVRYLEGQYARHRAGRRCSCASAPTHHRDAVQVDREYTDPPAHLMSPRYRGQRCRAEYQP